MTYLRALLVVSLIANALLLVTCNHEAPHASSASPNGTPAQRETTPQRTANKPARRAADDASAPREELEQRLVAAEAKAAELDSLEHRFENGTRSPEVEERVKPYLDDVFAPFEGPEPKYRVECHGRVCKLDTDLDRDWMEPLQTTLPGHTIFGGMSFQARPGKTFLELLRPEEIPRRFLNGMIEAALLRARQPCGFADAPHGDVSVRLAYNGTKHRLSKEVGGSLGTAPVANCVARFVDEVIATTTLPPEMSGSLDVAPWSVSLPLADDADL